MDMGQLSGLSSLLNLTARVSVFLSTEGLQGSIREGSKGMKLHTIVLKFKQIKECSRLSKSQATGQLGNVGSSKEETEVKRSMLWWTAVRAPLEENWLLQ